jgi:selenocysteine-specific elongation factor
VARWYSPPDILGGGTVLEPDAAPFRARDPKTAARLRPEQEATIQEILDVFRQAGWQPPSENEVTRSLGPHRATRDLWDYLAATDGLIALGDGLYLHPDTAEAGLAALRRLLKENGRVTVGTFRDAVSASRKAVVPFLEWCDTRRLTRREGDARVPGPGL